ncbi:MAG: zinc ribbon domain-containing protein [Clostridia bacterium]|nr:zinc ribbon domain-containing protein [Clostridia bacterium]
MAKICKACGAPLDDDAMFCAVCGTKVSQIAPQPAPQPAQQIAPQPAPQSDPQPAPQSAPQAPTSFCASCGAQVSPGMMFCANCGAPTAQAPAPKAARKAKTAKPKRPRKKINVGLLIANVLLIGACVAFIIAGIKLIPNNIREASLPYVPVEKNEIDGEIREEYDTVRSGGSLFGVPDEDADERSHVYFPVFDGEEDAD